MSDLVAFLNARLDEDEAIAREVQVVLDAGWNYFDEVPTKLIDPTRVLREVEAKRRILAFSLVCDEDGYGYGLSGDYLRRTLAAVYSDHPDPAWAQTSP